MSEASLAAANTVFRWIGMAGLAYLLWRIIVAALRVRWARNAYPLSEGEAVSVADEAWRNRCRGCLVGGAIGDAVNLPAESIPRWIARLRYPSGPAMRRGIFRCLRKPGDVSDDTQLTIAVARSIDLTGHYSHDRFVDELARWSYFRIGAGRASRDAGIRARRGLAPKESYSEGNGAAIRVAPLAIAADSRDELSELVRENAKATHTSVAAVDAAVFVALLLRECLVREPGFLENGALLKTAISDIEEQSGFALRAIVLNDSPSGHVHECIPAVVSVLSDHGSDLVGAMQAVFRAGGDCDSIGAIVAACIGSQLGYESLPIEWRESVQHSRVLLALSDQLAISPLETFHASEQRIADRNLEEDAEGSPERPRQSS